MDYFVNSWTNNYSGWATPLSDANKCLVCKKHYTFREVQAGYGEINDYLTAINSSMPHELYSHSYPPRNNWNGFSESSVMTGSLPSTSADIVKYGEYTDGDFDLFTFMVASDTTPCHLTICSWKDSGHEYMMHLYRTNGTTPANYTSFLSDNTSVTTSNGTFPLVKDVNLTTAYRQLGAPSANYVFQPVTVFGIKAPIYIVAGGHDSDLPWFTEINVGEDKFFTIDGNYAIKL